MKPEDPTENSKPQTGNRKPQTPNPFLLITNKELCEALGIDRKTSFRWRAKGLLPYVQLGQLIYYRSWEIWKLLENHTYRNAPKRPRS